MKINSQKCNYYVLAYASSVATNNFSAGITLLVFILFLKECCALILISPLLKDQTSTGMKI